MLFRSTQVRPALAGHWGDKLLTLELAHSVDMHAVIVRATAAQPSGLKADLLPGTDASWTKIGMPSACASESDFPSGTPKYERFSHSNESRVLTLGPFYAVRTDQTTRSTTRPSSRSSTWLRCATLSAHFFKSRLTSCSLLYVVLPVDDCVRRRARWRSLSWTLTGIVAMKPLRIHHIAGHIISKDPPRGLGRHSQLDEAEPSICALERPPHDFKATSPAAIPSSF